MIETAALSHSVLCIRPQDRATHLCGRLLDIRQILRVVSLNAPDSRHELKGGSLSFSFVEQVGVTFQLHLAPAISAF